MAGQQSYPWWRRYRKEGSTEAAAANDRAWQQAQAKPYTRWNPLPEQLDILREIYKRLGLRNPTKEQISKIAARLRIYGPIEDKNVFYWFQNQKAREIKHNKMAKEEAAAATAPPPPAGRSGRPRRGPYLGGAALNSHRGAPPTQAYAQRQVQQKGPEEPKLKTLPLFPLHSDNPSSSKAESSNGSSTPSLELSLKPYSYSGAP